MCDQTQVSYLPGDVVWVKLSPLWWPGQIVAKNEIDENIIKNLKSLVAVVKFFEEDTYEFVKNLSNIYHYNCLRKVEFIKKGLNALRSGIKGSSSNVKRFPEDVIAAEVLTGGNPNILNDDIFQPEEKVDYKDLFPSASSKKTPKRPRLSETAAKQKESPYGTPSPAIRTITHPRFIKSNLGLESNHDVKILIQKSSVSSDSPTAESSPTIYKCHACNFSTVRINVLILHNRSHWQNCDTSKNGKKKEGRSGLGSKNKSKIFSFVNQTPTGTKRKSETAGSFKKKVSSSADKTNRNSQTAAANQTFSDTVDNNKAPDSDDNLHDSLLEDWMEYENLVDGESKVDCVQIDDQPEKITNDDVKLKNKMSCFDFDETEDDSATVDSDSLYKRKIPRQIRERKLYSDTTECVPAATAVATAAATTDAAADDCRARNNVDRNKRICENSSELENASVDQKIINDLKRLSDEINVERINKFIDEVGNAALKPISKPEKNEEPLVTTLNEGDCRDDRAGIEDSITRRADNDRVDAEDKILYVNTGSDKYSSLNNAARTVEIVSESSQEHRDTSVDITNSDTVRKNISDENYTLQNGFVNDENAEEECLPSNMGERTVELVSEDLATAFNVNSNTNGNTENEIVTTTGHPNDNILRHDLVNTENEECLSVNYALNGIVLEQDLTSKNTNSMVEYAKNEIIIADDDRLIEKVNVSRYEINTEKTPNGVEKLTNIVLENVKEHDSTATDVNSNLHAIADNVFAQHTKFSSLGTNGPIDKSNLLSVQREIVGFNENFDHEISEEGKEESNGNYFEDNQEFSVTAADMDLKTATGVVTAEASNDNVTTLTDGSNDATQDAE